MVKVSTKITIFPASLPSLKTQAALNHVYKYKGMGIRRVRLAATDRLRLGRSQFFTKLSIIGFHLENWLAKSDTMWAVEKIC